MADSSVDDFEPPAFKIEILEENFDLNSPPTSGMEYLRRVQLETEKCATVVVANLNTEAFKENQTLLLNDCSSMSPAPTGYTSSLKWQRQQVANFSVVRQKFLREKAKMKRNGMKKPRMPLKENVEGWCRLCFGKFTNRQAQLYLNEADIEEDSSDDEASMDDVAFDSRTTSSQLGTSSDQYDAATNRHTREKMDQEDSSDDEASTEDTDLNSRKTTSSQHRISSKQCDAAADRLNHKKIESNQEGVAPTLSMIASMDQATIVKVLEYHINWFEATGFSPMQGQWFYCLLVALEKPLYPEVCSSLRTLVRLSSNLRATLESPDHVNRIPLNLLICLIARYFEQYDLADP